MRLTSNNVAFGARVSPELLDYMKTESNSLLKESPQKAQKYLNKIDEMQNWNDKITLGLKDNSFIIKGNNNTLLVNDRNYANSNGYDGLFNSIILNLKESDLMKFINNPNKQEKWLPFTKWWK